MSAVNVLPVPTIPNTDLVSDSEKLVDSVTNLAFSRTPLNRSLSPLKKSPSTLYAVIAVPALTEYLRNPVAPLDSPFT